MPSSAHLTISHFIFYSHYVYYSDLQNKCQHFIFYLHGEVLPTKELSDCASVGCDRRTVDNPLAARLASAWAAAISGFSGIALRRCAQYPVGTFEIDGSERPDYTPAVQRSPAET